MLKDNRASRCHALIQPQGEGEYWLVDFGSTNGTFVNGRRVTQPLRLHDADHILIGDKAFTFRKNIQSNRGAAHIDTSAGTVREIKTVPCWMLVADIVGSTRLSNTCPADELSVLLGRWFSACRMTIDECGGQINKFLGDGFLAYWPEGPSTARQVMKAVQKLCEAQNAPQPAFRWVLHHGPVSVGGPTSLGEESLLGSEVNFTFRMESLAGKLGLPRLVSKSALALLPLSAPCTPVGPHELKGFDGAHFFHTY